MNSHEAMEWVWARTLFSCQSQEIDWLKKSYEPTEEDRVAVAVYSCCDALSRLDLPGLQVHQTQYQTLYESIMASMIETYQRAKGTCEESDGGQVSQANVST